MCDSLRSGAAAVAVLMLSAIAAGQYTQEYPQYRSRVGIDSGYVVNATSERGVIWTTDARYAGAGWIRLVFGRAVLGAAPAGGEETVLRLSSLADGAEQTLTAENLEQWRNTSAYFNGEAVRVEIVADPGAAPSRVAITELLTNNEYAGVAESICGIDDDRELWTDPRVARRFPSGCTTWLIDDPNHCFLTAGHCATAMQIVEFNVPLSSSTGVPLHPSPADQYAVDQSSMQTNFGQGVGDDWAYFGCYPNPQTGLFPHEAQESYFVLAPPPVAAPGQNVRVSGYGSVEPPMPNTWNYALTTHVGPLVAAFGTTLQYQVDTTGGNSGSPIINDLTGEAIGIHTHGGCASGTNFGTSSTHSGLQYAIAHPQGVCALGVCPGDFNDSGVVGFDDIILLIAAWGPCPGCPQDLDTSGTVGIDDIFELVTQWGACP